ncbi:MULTISPECIES: beta-ketoacyl-[acyl-carrier-protein] synthase family protein [unclassified Streptomyces]|uniref:beta-ketoacyl-[acyl-carrier-protein] synthase family protein n=1 Tax=unclassified Streptomyces TaxID=2593676 RepID=UPI0022547F85|nr:MULTISPECIES: beta-ketoacyl-[acyl-carrier-protein] synthase family protein [unclassified Streptomyces]WSP53216.1 beta-ketoacyl-[acyl-carrier-protein] synthase family protein [Streptomyces sp. NBC_01241]MCX4792127.1 beta-ketoacyl-[acyl-carrier-protein] synthase family protein [Streptomyces sp. NBC_01221]MCX4799980.1 beta-ketoacyl-[acyl-carrier-protein] synthase family protein [Streptomyces sp. NBC_01242]WSJ40627.1 beta-ketoacyl-[acyl-carrier-protein] synthase family protein [Streptomyces sp. 
MADAGVWVTGLGATTPLAGDVATTWSAMLAGKNGVAVLDDPWASALPVRLAARMRVDPAAAMRRTEARRMDRCEQAAVVSAREAWADAGRPDVDPERLAVVIGTGVGGVLSLLEQDDILEVSGPRKVSPHTVPMLMANGPAAWVSIDLGARGGAHTPVSACASGAEAIALGLDLIRLGRADVVVAGGTEACVHGLPLAGFAQMMALATTNNEPDSASRPFDSERNGFVLGEGAAVLVLERRDFARDRGARAHGTLVGAGVTSSAQHITASDTAGQVRTIRMALAAGGLAPEDIGLVHAHATSTPQGDLAEANAVEEAVGTHPVVTATKSMTGHLLGASGALGAIATLLALRDGIAPATRNLDKIDPAINLDVVSDRPRQGAWTAGMANSFGFGGHNVSLAFTTVR